MIISAIAAVSKNRVIGRDSEIPWHLPEDLKWFKKHTLNHHVIMGRKTYESMGRPLSKRINIIVTRDVFYAVSGCFVVHSVEEALDFARDNHEEEAFILGGGEIYKQTVHLWDKIYLTEVEVELDGDTYFPSIEEKEWKEVFSEKHRADERNEADYTFKILERQKK